MKPLVVGTLSIDTLEFVDREFKGSYGGSASFAVMGAALFGPTRLVTGVGEDFPEEFRAILAQRQVDLAGMKVHAGEKTFRWHGRYQKNLNHRETVEMALNVMEHYFPELPPSFCNSRPVMIANMPPSRQQRVLEQLTGDPFVMLDTVDDWVIAYRDDLIAVLSKIHMLLINDSEARLLANTGNLLKAGRRLQAMGPKAVLIKKGEHGCLLIDKAGVTALPAFPTENVVDPTGAGDSFAGGLLGYLGTCPEVTPRAVRRGMCYGHVVASLTVEDYGLKRLQTATIDEVNERMKRYLEMLDVSV
jgi:sugar/nucleoside kinase (ribokinase family)